MFRICLPMALLTPPASQKVCQHLNAYHGQKLAYLFLFGGNKENEYL
jgi:hypothetical protein